MGNFKVSVKKKKKILKDFRVQRFKRKSTLTGSLHRETEDSATQASWAGGVIVGFFIDCASFERIHHP